MPLKLLGKKSWNPYLEKNLCQVKADEKAFAARDEELQRLQDAYEGDARLAQLRGEPPPSLPPRIAELKQLQEDAINGRLKSSSGPDDRHDDRRKRRKLQGEDDTDRDIRVARQASQHDSIPRPTKNAKTLDMPIVDNDGHIQLFAGNEDKQCGAVRKHRNEDVKQQEVARSRGNESEFRFGDRPGYQQKTADGPWYAGGRHDNDGDKAYVNVFGKEDSGREKRAEARTLAIDPMSVMKAAQAKFNDTSRSGPDRYKTTVLNTVDLVERLYERKPRRQHSSHHHRHEQRDQSGTRGSNLKPDERSRYARPHRGSDQRLSSRSRDSTKHLERYSSPSYVSRKRKHKTRSPSFEGAN